MDIDKRDTSLPLPVIKQSAMRNADFSSYYAEQIYSHKGPKIQQLDSETVNRSVTTHYQCCLLRQRDVNVLRLHYSCD